MSESLSKELEAAAAEIMVLKEMAVTRVMLETKAGKIWSISRENKESLNSERFVKLIMDTLVEATSDIQRRMNAEVRLLKAEKIKTKHLRNEIKDLKKECNELECRVKAFEEGKKTREANARSMRRKWELAEEGVRNLSKTVEEKVERIAELEAIVSAGSTTVGGGNDVEIVKRDKRIRELEEKLLDLSRKEESERVSA